MTLFRTYSFVLIVTLACIIAVGYDNTAVSLCYVSCDENVTDYFKQ